MVVGSHCQKESKRPNPEGVEIRNNDKILYIVHQGPILNVEVSFYDCGITTPKGT